ncbi:MAG: sugar transferase [Nocardiopsaceae bacterium]|nr:sugar transferase [Nocardiopsaceae bacterium]
MTGQTAITTARRDRVGARFADLSPASWTAAYIRNACAADGLCGLAAGVLAFVIRFSSQTDRPAAYLGMSLVMPLAWLLAVLLAGGYDSRFIGVGTDEFRKIINAGVFLTATVAVVSYATKADIARGYIVIALPSVTLFDLAARYMLRKRLHRIRAAGACMRRVVLVGYRAVVQDMAEMLRRETQHGLLVTAACVVDADGASVISDIPAFSGLENISEVVRSCEADTVAVLACPEMSGYRLRALAWELEKTGTDLCVASALLDVAGPRTTIRPVAGLPLLHLDHPEFTGTRLVIKAAFDKTVALGVLVFAFPLMALLALAVKLDDGGPAFFRQTRVGKDGRMFTVYKFRTMVIDAEQRRDNLRQTSGQHSVLFKLRNDPRITRAGTWLRRWSLDELPQLVNVLNGDMSLVGPRPALPEEAAMYGDHVRRRLVVKPGITGLWQVSGRSDLTWDDSIRLDLRYVENWSLMLDLNILWKTLSAVVRGSGAY